MRQIDLTSIAPQVRELGRRAGDAILQIYRDPSGHAAVLHHKLDNSPLTEADLASHQLICEGLGRLTPQVPVVSEEDGASASRPGADAVFWLVDPLDGTKEFLAGNGEFTVNIALISEGEPVWGLVVAPALGLTYWGGKSLGSFRQVGEEVAPIQVTAPVPPGGRYRVVASKSHMNARTTAYIARLGEVDLVQAGSSLKLCRVAEGLADVYPRLAPTCEWDTAAAQAVVEGAGGWVYDPAGDRLRYGKPNTLNPDFVASSMPANLLGALWS